MKRYEVDFKCLALDGATYEEHTCYLMKESEAEVKKHVKDAVALSGYSLDHFTLEDVREIEEPEHFDSFVREKRKAALTSALQKGIIEAGLEGEVLPSGNLFLKDARVIIHTKGIEVILYEKPQEFAPDLRERPTTRKLVNTAEEVLQLLTQAV